MSHSESAIAGFYDHEQDPTRGRTARDAPDWGGDDLFTGTPRRRRFDRPSRGEQHTVVRRDTLEHPLPRRVSGAVSSPARDEASEVARLDLGTIADVMAPVADAAGFEPPVPALTEDVPEVEGHAIVGAPGPRTEEPPRVGRRTVTVTGHPDPVPVRRRPAPTVDERLIGSRPDRIAAYAFGLGLLLILIAFLTAQA